MTRTLIVGDVHGCLEELEALVDKVGLRSEDQLVLVGDLVAKGPDSAGVVRYARESRAFSVRGNHEDHWLRARADGKGRSLSDADWAYLEQTPDRLTLALCPVYAGLRRPAVHVVHAGFVPGIKLQDQDPELMKSMRTVHDGEGSSHRKGRPWAAEWPGPDLVVFGHDAARGLQQRPHALGLDTGCCYGGELSGALIEGDSLSLVSVPAKAVYKPIS
ncbi:MAG: metallophosphoesterase family protein [Polyangiales bacterium]